MKYDHKNPILRALVESFTALCLLFVSAAGFAEPTPGKAAQVKAAFILNFIKLTTWQDSAFAQTTSPITVAVVGNSETETALVAAASEIHIQGRALAFQHTDLPVREKYANAAEYQQAWTQTISTLRTSHVVMFLDDTHRQADEIIKDMDSRSTLTVGDGRQFQNCATMLSLDEVQGRIVFYANAESIQKSDLTISARLLRLAKTPER